MDYYEAFDNGINLYLMKLNSQKNDQKIENIYSNMHILY